MRIIAGALKGRRLATPEPGSLDIRPTADRAREALFSILQRWPQGGFVDLFSGTGAVALEAHSRGYGPVTAAERAPGALALLQRNAKGTPVVVKAGDVLRLKEDAFRDQAVVFVDPPYADVPTLWPDLARHIRPWMLADGVLVVETDRGTELAPQAGWEQVDDRRYGAARFHFLEPR